MQQSVCEWLEVSKGVQVQQNWVEACLEWLEQEEGCDLPMGSVREKVYEQWLHADLRDVVIQPCIPSSVTDQQTTTITGHFIVQVDSLIDVGAAAYSQIQRLKGQALDDAEAAKKNFEPKPTRLLLLTLTDGVTDFQGMEYLPIPQLASDLTPGTKLLLQGSIGCRLGTLLLTGDQVQVLGGGVEALAEANHQMRVLARALNDESLAGEVVGDSDGPSHPTTDSRTVAGVARQDQLAERNGEGEMEPAVVDITDLDLENFEDFEDLEEDQPPMQEAQLQDDDQWPDDVNFSPHASLVEEDGLEQTAQLGEGEREHSVGSTHTELLSRSVGQKRRHHYLGTTTTDDFSGGYNPPGCAAIPGPSGLGMTTEKRSRTQGYKQSSHFMGESAATIPELGWGGTTELRSLAGDDCKLLSNERRVNEQFDSQSVASRESGTRKPSVHAVRPLNIEYTAGACGAGDAGGAGGAGAGDRVCSELGPMLRGKQRMVGSIPTVQSVAEAADVWATEGSLVRLKARFVRVASKLTPADHHWTVEVVVEDGEGGQINVKLSDQVLEKLIGFSAQEFVEDIQPNKSDPAVRARGSKGFKHCQSCLATLDCLMEIRRPASFADHPTVERLLDPQ